MKNLARLSLGLLCSALFGALACDSAAAQDAGLGTGFGLSFGAVQAGTTAVGSISGAGGIAAAATIGDQTVVIGQAVGVAETASLGQAALNLQPTILHFGLGINNAQTKGAATARGAGSGGGAGSGSSGGGVSFSQIGTYAMGSGWATTAKGTALAKALSHGAALSKSK